MDVTPVTSKQYFRTLNIIYLALLAGQCLFLAGSYLLTDKGTPPLLPPAALKLLRILLPVLIAGAYLLGRVLAGARLNKLKEIPDLPTRLRGYQSLRLLHHALLEAPVLLGILLFYLGHDPLFLVFSGLGIVVFALTGRPSRQRLETALDLPYEERALLDDPDAALYETERTTR